ncbi:MAG: exodeoxyribonuclease I [Gammaproteobacteria bacterium]|nr:exodeoxyribonuclease I [Gammaproteobacteria bacterium]
MATHKRQGQSGYSGPTLYWHDYETFGVDPRRDRPAQFAGIRTDLDFNIIGEPLSLYCRPANDFLPAPEACLVTGITPQKALAEGVPEAEFIRQIHAEFSQPNTCVVGYNNIRFDDEVTRTTLYRNFYDPYAREWQNGNSRWDIIDMLRLTHALRPEGIRWPTHADGKTSFRLEQLTAINGISHEAAHDALSDVQATIAMARLIKEKQPRLYDYVYRHRSKQSVAQLLNIARPAPVLHVSSMYPAERGCIALVAPLAAHPVNKNELIVYDLSVSPQPFLALRPDEMAERLFTRQDALPEGCARLPVKTVHINKSPVLVPVTTLTAAAAEKWQLNVTRAQQNLAVLLAHADFSRNLQAVYKESRSFEAVDDPDFMLYSGGFFSNDDRDRMEIVRQTVPQQLASLDLPFQDQRLSEMLFRYRARNYPEFLSEDENRRWDEFRLQRLTMNSHGAGLSLSELRERIALLKQTSDLDQKQQHILDALLHYAESITNDLLVDA